MGVKQIYAPQCGNTSVSIHAAFTDFDKQQLECILVLQEKDRDSNNSKWGYIE